MAKNEEVCNRRDRRAAPAAYLAFSEQYFKIAEKPFFAKLNAWQNIIKLQY
jgi:hypothetical protein